MTSMKDYAQEYADRGWAVFPLHNIESNGTCSCGTNCKSRGKHPRTSDGFKGATTDRSQIDLWWDRWPNANIGVATGETSGIWVLDVDNKRTVEIGGGNLISEGQHSLRELENEHGSLPPTLTQRTGSGGYHHIFAFPIGGDHKTRTNFRPSLDVRSTGGYIVVPPSNHEHGTYGWIDEEYPIARAPGWLLGAAATPIDPGESILAKLYTGERIAVGGRNDAIFKLASMYRGTQCMGYQQLLSTMLRHNEYDTEEPLGGDEVERIVASAVKLSCNPEEPEWVSEEDEEDAPDRSKSTYLSAAELMSLDITPPTPIVHGLVDGGTGIILGGAPNVGKTFWALDMAIAVATGGKFLDEYDTTQGPVLFIDEEGNEWGDQDRLGMLVEGRGIGSLVGVPLYFAIGKGNKLDTTEGLSNVRLMISEIKPTLVIIDSLIRVHGGDENLSKDMSSFFDISTKLRKSTGTAFMFVHHTRKEGVKFEEEGGDIAELFRGSSEIRAWPDIMFMLRNGEGGMIKTENLKQRWREKPEPFNVRRLVSSDGKEMKLGYMGTVEKKTKGPSPEDRIIAAIEALEEQGPVSAAVIALHTGMKTGTVGNRLSEMTKNGQVVRDPHRQPYLYTLPVQRREDGQGSS